VTVLSADYADDERRVHLLMAYVPVEGLPGLVAALQPHLTALPPGRDVVLDVHAWRTDGALSAAQSAELVQNLLEGVRSHPLHQFDVELTTGAYGSGRAVSHHLTFRMDDEGRLTEDLLHRDMHPMIAKRLELWRLQNFKLERLESVEDVYLFHGIAHENPKDERLVALAEVRDLTPTRSASGRVVGLPLLERILAQTVSAMRLFQLRRSPGQRLLQNRVILYVRPPLDLPPGAWRDVAHRLAPTAQGLGLEEVLVRARIPDPVSGELVEQVLHVSDPGSREVSVRRTDPVDEPVQPLSEYRRRVLQATRRGATYPYEIVRLITPPSDGESGLPPGEFVEHDLDDDGRLVPVDREYGKNTANLVVGVVRNWPPTCPEGMARVILLGDPSRSLGALAEPECRRINAALDLAEQMHVPLEWFAISSGALISMTSGTENMDWISAVLRRIIEFTQGGGEINVVVTGINVGAQPYWNAEATMLMHTKGILVMTPQSAMVLTGKQALDFSGGVSAEDNLGIGGYERVMGPNGQGQYWAPDLPAACMLLFRHYDVTYIVPGEQFPRRAPTSDPVDRDIRTAEHPRLAGSDFTSVGDIFSPDRNPDRKKPFEVRAVMRATMDADCEPLERWARWGDTAIVWDGRVGGIPVCMLGMDSKTVQRAGFVPADGPSLWTSGTLFPQASRKVARAVNAASGNRPLVVLANLSGFDGSPESMRQWQLEYGAEIGRAVTNFRGPIVFVVVSRYHGGAFVVFSKALNESLEIAAVEGSFASVIGGTPAAAVVFAHEVDKRVRADQRVLELTERVAVAGADGRLRLELQRVTQHVRSEKLGEVASEFDAIHSIDRALAVGSVDRIISAADLRPYVIDALERGLAKAMDAAVS
jgi:acetyl-CoA carboxylase carboxyltransferase component